MWRLAKNADSHCFHSYVCWVLQESGMTAFVFKDDAGGMEPQLQRTNGVPLVASRADAQRAHRMLKT